ncbi:hypothetical protein ATCC90586_004194 [Pythium insidiosum]|nr:hypothetical protein ATCC90586_004194 [Pythium insidiosum]
MPPQKRGRSAAKDAAKPDAEMKDAEAPAGRVPGDEQSDSDDSDDDSDDDDELTFAEQMHDSDDDDEEEKEEEEDEAMDGGASKQKDARHVNVDFVFSDPREAHFHSVKQFLLSYLPSSQPFDVSGLANVIVSQAAVGTMVCVDGEDDVYGFITALGLQRYASETSVQQIVAYVTKRCPADDAARFQQLLSTRRVALVVNERLVNLPYQLVPHVHSALHQDIEWAVAESAEGAEAFQFDYFLILSSCTMEGASSSKPKGKKKAKTEFLAATAKMFSNFEDEFLEAEADVTFTFETPRGERESASDAHKHTVVMLIERSRHKAALGTISAMINA